MQEIGNYKRSDKNWKALNTYRHQEIQKQKQKTQYTQGVISYNCREKFWTEWRNCL